MDISRRSILAGVGATGLFATSRPAATAAMPALPWRVSLPPGLRPEGITTGPGDTFYVGSLADGRLLTGDLSAGTVRTLWPGQTGRQLRGLAQDPRTGLVWAAGNLGSSGRVYAVDSSSGEVVHTVSVPGARFLNDLVVTDRAVWVTDSFVDRLTRITLRANGIPASLSPGFLALGGQWPAGDGQAINANGIRELPDGMLILNNSRVGRLWQAHPQTGRVTRIKVNGGPGLLSGDGLELDGSTLYDVRGSGDNEISVLELRSTPGGWTAAWFGVRRSRDLDVPSTCTVAGGWLYAVNARFGVPDPDSANYWIARLPARPI